MRQEIYQQSFAYGESDGLQIKLYLSKILEDVLAESTGNTNGKVADMNFAYYNSWLLDKLRERGDFIKMQQWDKLNAINKQIKDTMHGTMTVDGVETETLPEWTTPKCAFVSIESEEAYNALCEYGHEGEAGKIMIGGSLSTIKEAPEPTNVIWENRDF